ncbi:MAG: HTH-type transcriptional regulator IscR [Phycisphaerae bacterium]|nr:HTH-type transcriptional regulator IscR [Phycisphaerae bacterium]
MLSLTKKTEYALIAMSHLARRDGKLASAREIAERYSLPLPVLMNILKKLNHENLVDSVRGAKGGYRLAVRSEDLSLTRLIEAIEGPVRLIDCADFDHDRGTDHGDMCVRMGGCPIRGPVMKVHRRLQEFLSTITLADIVRQTIPGEPLAVQLAPAQPGTQGMTGA